MNRNSHVEVVRVNLRWTMLYLGLAILIPTLVLIFIPVPEGVTFGQWVQRAGTFVIVGSLLAEIPALKVDGAFKPAGMAGPDYREAVSRYGTLRRLVQPSILFLATLGTVMTGYGDVLYKAIVIEM